MQPAEDDIAYLLFTSGSTGTPKGVMHSFRTMSMPANALVEALGFHSGDRALSYLPLAHALERMLLESVSFVCGAHLFFAESLDTFADDLRRATDLARLFWFC